MKRGSSMAIALALAGLGLVGTLAAGGPAPGVPATPTPEPSQAAVAALAPTPTPEPAPTPPPYDYSQPVPEGEPVGEGYFADAVFIGDSRTDGFRMFSGLTQGDFLVKTGLSVFQLDTDRVRVDGKKMTVPEALSRKTYGKVYICLGLNELGMEDDQGYYDHYAAFLDDIGRRQPEAAVYIQLLIPVNEEKCAEKRMAGYINNAQIAVYNDLLRQLALEKQVFLLDPAQAIVDPATGQPLYQEVADGVHFQKEPYQRWLDYLERHTAPVGPGAVPTKEEAT